MSEAEYLLEERIAIKIYEGNIPERIAEFQAQKEAEDDN